MLVLGLIALLSFVTAQGNITAYDIFDLTCSHFKSARTHAGKDTIITFSPGKLDFWGEAELE